MNLMNLYDEITDLVYEGKAVDGFSNVLHHVIIDKLMERRLQYMSNEVGLTASCQHRFQVLEGRIRYAYEQI